jgi:gluconate 2-dehydrogenase alpha chain
MSAGASGFGIADFEADNFDHTDLGFIGGMHIHSVSGGQPITILAVPQGTPSWGAAWKKAVRDWYDRSVTVSGLGNVLAYRTNHLDLDPTYRDVWGDPLLRITFDWHDNELGIARYGASQIEAILAAMAPDHLEVHGDTGSFDTARYQGTHNTGGAIMGTDPRLSVVNPHLQMWEFPNVWVVGGSAFPQNGTPGPTGTICALAYLAAESVIRSARIGPLSMA